MPLGLCLKQRAGGRKLCRVWNTRTNHGQVPERRVCVLLPALFPTPPRASLVIVCFSNLRTLFSQDRHSLCACPSPAHPHTLRYGRSRQAPVYIAARIYGHCRTTRTGPRAASSQRLQFFVEHSSTEFTARLYIQSTPMYRSHRSTQHPHQPTGRTCMPSVSETPDEPLLHV
jgi:hypothetical protein